VCIRQSVNLSDVAECNALRTHKFKANFRKTFSWGEVVCKLLNSWYLSFICVFLGIVCVSVYFWLSFCVVNDYCKLQWIKIIIIIIIIITFTACQQRRAFTNDYLNNEMAKPPMSDTLITLSSSSDCYDDWRHRPFAACHTTPAVRSVGVVNFAVVTRLLLACCLLHLFGDILAFILC